MTVSVDRFFPALLAAGIACALVPASAAVAGQPATPVAAQAQWKIWGGEAVFRWNRDLMSDLGVEVSPAIGGGKADVYGREALRIGDAAALDFAVREGGFNGFTGGSLVVRGGFGLRIGKEAIALRDFRLVPRADNGFVLDLVGSEGTAWLYIDRMMYEVEGGDTPVLAIQAMDLRVGPGLARRLGRPDAEGLAVANVEMYTRIHSDNGDPEVFRVKRGSNRWPGTAVPNVPGATYQADVFMHHFDAQYSRKSSDASGSAGSGRIVFTPSSTLRNNRNNGTARVTVPCLAGGSCPSAPSMNPDPLGTSSALHAADVVWNQKFTGNTAPYGNDQHPYLIWNLYRLDAEGRIEQVGRSGVKHAWLTTNTACDDNPSNGHILGLGCTDTYGTGNNDAIADLGPRSEIIPAQGLWGRCGSVFDADCNGARDSGAPCSNVTGVSDCTNWAFRMQVDERDISAAVTPGGAYWFESWYIVRDDIDIYNTMQTRPVTFTWSGGTWNVGNGAGTGLKLGPAIDRWMPRGTSTATERSTDIEERSGQARLAVRVTQLASGAWRYDYVVANFDFAVGETSGVEPNLRVLSNTGFTGLALALGDVERGGVFRRRPRCRQRLELRRERYRRRLDAIRRRRRCGHDQRIELGHDVPLQFRKRCRAGCRHRDPGGARRQQHQRRHAGARWRRYARPLRQRVRERGARSGMTCSRKRRARQKKAGIASPPSFMFTAASDGARDAAPAKAYFIR